MTAPTSFTVFHLGLGDPDGEEQQRLQTALEHAGLVVEDAYPGSIAVTGAQPAVDATVERFKGWFRMEKVHMGVQPPHAKVKNA